MRHERLEATVHGRVQMVMYRDFARRVARRLRLTGEVKNLSDGTVRVIAEGARPELEAFAKRLKRGSLPARVDRVDTAWKQAAGTYGSFDIMYG